MITDNLCSSCHSVSLIFLLFRYLVSLNFLLYTASAAIGRFSSGIFSHTKLTACLFCLLIIWFYQFHVRIPLSANFSQFSYYFVIIFVLFFVFGLDTHFPIKLASTMALLFLRNLSSILQGCLNTGQTKRWLKSSISSQTHLTSSLSGSSSHLVMLGLSCILEPQLSCDLGSSIQGKGIGFRN